MHPATGGRGFGRLLTAVIASNLGDGLVLAAFPLLAASLTRDPLVVAGLSIAGGLPWLLLSPLSGAIVDRYDRRRLMKVFDLGRACVVAALSLFIGLGGESVSLLYVVVFLIATGETIVDTSAQAVLPALVPPSELDRANGRLFSTQTVAHRFIGPPLGGFLFGLATTLPVAADAASFLVAATIIGTLPGKFKPELEETASPNIWASTREGLRWLWSNPPIRAFAMGAAVINVGVVAGESILVLFAQDQLGLSGPGFGMLFAATAIGYTAGAAVASRLAKLVSRLTVVILSVAVISLASATIGWAGDWILAAIGLATIGVASGLWDVIAVSYRQAAVPDRLLGRIMAAYRFIAYGAFPVGAVVGGISAHLGGNRAPFLIGALVIATLLPYLVVVLRAAELDPARLHS